MKQFHKEGMTVVSCARNRSKRSDLDFEIIFDESPNFCGAYSRTAYAAKGKHTGELFIRIAGCRIYFKEDADGNFECVDIERYEEFKFQRMRGRKARGRRVKATPKAQQQGERREGEQEEEQPKEGGREKLKRIREKREEQHPEWEAKDEELEQEEQEKELNDLSWRDLLGVYLNAGVPVYLAGPAGCGKSYAVADLCTEMDWEFYSTSSVQQEFKLDGFIDALGDYQSTEFYKAAKAANEGRDCVYFIDEMDASIPEVLVKLNMAIANGYHEFPTGRIEFDTEHLHFVAAGNTVGNGADDLYTGRMVLDAATLNRFVVVEATYEREVEIKLANGDEELVDFIEGLRECAERIGIRTVFSYRQIQYAARMKNVLNRKQIIKTCIIGTLDADTVRTLYTFQGGKWQEAFDELKAA